MATDSRNPIVLEYTKRRYDGGSEIQLIEQIEKQYSVYEHQKAVVGLEAAWDLNPSVKGTVQSRQHPEIEEVLESRLSKATRQGLKARLYKALVIPYVELILGLSGILLGAIMFVSLIKDNSHDPEVLKQERQNLIKQSVKVVINSIGSILVSPWRAARVCLR